MDKRGDRVLLGAAGGLFALLVLMMFPAGVFFSYVYQVGFLNILLPSIAIVALGGALMAWAWPKLLVGHQAALTLAFLVFGIFGFPAFTAIGLVGLVLTAWVYRGSRMKAKAK